MRQVGSDILHPMIHLVIEPGHLQRNEEPAFPKHGQKKDESDDEDDVVEQKIRMEKDEERHANGAHDRDIEEIGHHRDQRACQQVRLGEPMGMLRKECFFPNLGKRFRECDCDARVNPLLQRLDGPGLQDTKGGGTGQRRPYHEGERQDHDGLDGKGERADEFLYGNRDAQHEHADGDGIRRNDAEHLPFEADEESKMSNDILDDVREPILWKGGVGSRIRHGRPVLAFGLSWFVRGRHGEAHGAHEADLIDLFPCVNLYLVPAGLPTALRG